MTRWRGSRKRAAGRWDTTQVRLVRLDVESAESALLREAVLEHDLPPEQLRFTGLPVRTLPDADQDPERVPYAIVALDAALTGPDSARAACAGFGVLDRVIGSELVDAPERAVLMRAYYVTPQWQGRGVGRASCSAPLLDRLAAEVAPHAELIVLCVNQANQQAQRAYRAAGFDFTGKVVPGTAGPQDVMARPLGPPTETRAHATPEPATHPEPRTRYRRTENSQ
ncbi:GNAT family N-acetyltransferase [Nocardiopsis metallicus]|uniref:Ribosomal protein S18 acetylase RimI-like enzyme n=1 Tax=Nocardiopsis metallicus TaxID=179819 RepID=A0A840W746_9ACTN|nr:GNAT family N-acetyltransferase [Nocardiopsis metallicus]MBB5491854.1 ribosomal protein S18 acetylase RimI-like enzyme [Nocardiopsis metallicus]